MPCFNLNFKQGYCPLGEGEERAIKALEVLRILLRTMWKVFFGKFLEGQVSGDILLPYNAANFVFYWESFVKTFRTVGVFNVFSNLCLVFNIYNNNNWVSNNSEQRFCNLLKWNTPQIWPMCWSSMTLPK